MPPAKARTAWIVLCLAIASPAFAQYEVEEEERVWLRALLDVRLARAGPDLSWTDAGFGKTRYGGQLRNGELERATRFGIAQLALEAGAALPWGVRAQAQVNFQPDVADQFEPWLIEANLRKEWGGAKGGWGLQTGLMNLPFSLEHTGAAWLPELTLSASALNSWIWEDTSLAGAEGEWWHVTSSGFRFGALVGGGFGSDTFGRLLALRGWAMGDVLGGWNGDLQLPARTERTRIFDERDDRPAVYAWLTATDAQEFASLKVGYLDNLGDQNVGGVWHTRFSTVGFTVHPHSRVDVMVQFLDGTMRVRAPPNDSDIRAYYALTSYHHKRQRLTVRYDSFRIDDVDGGPVSTRERGDAVTATYMMQFGLRHRVAFEYIWLNSRRPATGVASPTPDGWQLSYRFRY